MFLTVMISVGLFAMRLAIARPAVRRVAGHEAARASRSRSLVASALGLLAMPVYLEEATAIDSLRSFFAARRARAALADDRVRARATSTSGSASPSSASPRWIALWVDRPDARAPLDRRDPRRDRRRRGGRGACSSSPAPPATPPRPRRAGSPSRSTGCTSSRARSGSAGSSACSSLWWSLPAGQPDRRALGRRAPVLERRLRLGARPARLGDLGGDPAPAAPLGALDDLLRPGDPGQGRAARDRDAARRGQPRCARSRGSSRRAAAPSSAPVGARSCAVSSRSRRCS